MSEDDGHPADRGYHGRHYNYQHHHQQPQYSYRSDHSRNVSDVSAGRSQGTHSVASSAAEVPTSRLPPKNLKVLATADGLSYKPVDLSSIDLLELRSANLVKGALCYALSIDYPREDVDIYVTELMKTSGHGKLNW